MTTGFALMQKGEPMSDLIDRQAAIAAVSNWIYDRDDGRSVDQLLSALPSAQPEKQHGRIFQGIVVEYPSISTYPEHEGKPYFSIKYVEDGQSYIGYGTYKPEVLSEYMKEYFILSVHPQQIVRCKDCKYWMRENVSDGYCSEMNIGDCDEDFYCGYAEVLTMEEFMDGQDMGNPEDGSL
jgi:hypothetical protein